MQTKRQQWVRIAILTVSPVVFLSFALIPWWLRKAHKNDLEGAVPQQGVATVALLVRPGPTSLGNPTTPEVLVRFQGQLLPVKTVQEIEALAVDQPARIEYRVGKSGRIYVDTVAPMQSSTIRETR